MRDMTLKDRLAVLDGFDYDTALMNCGGEEDFLKEILADIPSDCDERIDRMKNSLNTGNHKNYSVEAHAIKSLMATVGIKGLSEWAKKHEYASRDGDIDYVRGDYESFISEYRHVCDIIKDAV